MKKLKRLAAIFLFAFLAAFAGARAEDTAALRIEAHPALWRIHGAHGSVTLLGSIHVIPANVNWLTPEIAKAMDEADTFVFEIPVDADAIKKFDALKQARGTLPRGQTLRQLLPPEAQADFDRVLAKLQIPEAAVANMRPWLAALVIDQAVIKRQLRKTAPGPDFAIAAAAGIAGKKTRALETVEQQLALIAPADPTDELDDFEIELKNFDINARAVVTLAEAWEKGDTAALDGIVKQEYETHPEAMKAFFTDRNLAWAKQIEAMLGESKNFFIVVGVGHLTGEDSVPALLRAEGFMVEGP